ncbi:Mur ligase family protein [Rhabdothermincola sediminis]|uniref:Mur ligase family protein n=1 Tax=Rhabdothermincola sediminis TaxID=2751370 RepID=UPI001AA07999|nr:Mur ligase family protein [Rhabdothermincola sediminis]
MDAAAPAQPGRRPRWRSRIAVAAGRAVADASRLSGLGSGSVIGGRVSLLLDRHLLAHLTARVGREVALVSATNGKTTTTRLLSAALAADRPVVSNTLGANMPPGHVAALGRARLDATAVLEVDERWLGVVLAETRAGTVVLLNLSRDQLDRSFEVRQIAQRWRGALAADPPRQVVANADDPLVVWAAMGTDATDPDAPGVHPGRGWRTIWVGTGDTWRGDATGCPACGGRLSFEGGGWSCLGCDLARPEPDLWLDGDAVAHRDGRRTALELRLPGRVNRANAALALAAAEAMGATPEAAAAAMADVDDVAGRYRTVTVDGCRARLLLAKNPAGWREALDMLAPPPQPVVVAINARVADGHDPSWLWDVPFERLRGRRVVATGERRHDLAVRLRYAAVDHVVADTLAAAVQAAGSPAVDVAANYTAFQDALETLR